MNENKRNEGGTMFQNTLGTMQSFNKMIHPQQEALSRIGLDFGWR